MKKTLLTAAAVLAAGMILPLAAAPQMDAKTVHALEVARPLDPGKIQLRGDTPDQKCNYKVGEEMKFTLSLSYGKQKAPAKPYQIKIERFGEDGVKKTETRVITENQPVRFVTRAAKPGFVIVQATLLDSDGKVVANKWRYGRYNIAFTGGLGAELEKVKAEPRPQDFDRYWDNEVRKLAAVKPEAKLTPIPNPNPKSTALLYTFEIPTPGSPRPTCGYLSIPRKPGKYPARVLLSGYGNVESLTQVKKYPEKTIIMQISRYGALPGQPKEYYAAIKKEIGRYGLENNEDREKCYFKQMLLRDLRALQYLKTLEKWNGKDIFVIGGSMGGLQGFWMAGLDPAVSEVSIHYPWSCDLEGSLLTRPKSRFAPPFTPALRYFDAVNFAHRFNPACKVRMSTGIGDMVCPVSGVYRAYAECPARDKELTLIQGATHSPCHRNPQKYLIRGSVTPADSAASEK